MDMQAANEGVPGNEASLAIPAETSLSDYAYNRIVEMMLGGSLAVGEVLQERKLGEALSMSRTPVREALARLEAESLVMRRHGRVLVVSDTGIETYINLLDMRRILEVEAAGRATGQDQPGADRRRSSRRSMSCSRRPRSRRRTTGPSTRWCTARSPRPQGIRWSRPPSATSAGERTSSTPRAFPHRLLPGASEHIALLHAVSGNDPELSRRMMGEHLDNVKNAIIECILGVRGPYQSSSGYRS